MLNKCSPVALSISGAQTHSRDSLWSTLQVGSEAPLWEQGRGPDPTSCRPLQEHQWPGHKVRNPQGSFPPNCLRIQPSPVRGCLGGGPGRSTPVHHSSQQRGGLDCQSVLGWSPETSPGPRGPTPSCSELRLPLQTRASPFRPAGSPRFCMKLNRSSRNSFLLGSPSSSYSYEGKEGTG